MRSGRLKSVHQRVLSRLHLFAWVQSGAGILPVVENVFSETQAGSLCHIGASYLYTMNWYSYANVRPDEYEYCHPDGVRVQKAQGAGCCTLVFLERPTNRPVNHNCPLQECTHAITTTGIDQATFTIDCLCDTQSSLRWLYLFVSHRNFDEPRASLFK